MKTPRSRSILTGLGLGLILVAVVSLGAAIGTYSPHHSHQWWLWLYVAGTSFVSGLFALESATA